MKIDTDSLRSHLKLRCFNIDLEVLCEQQTVENLRSFFLSFPRGFRLSQTVSLLRACTDVTDAQAMDVFDLLDCDGRGCLRFTEFYFLCCLLVAYCRRELKKFMYQRWDDISRLLQAKSRDREISTGSKVVKVPVVSVCCFFRILGQERDLFSKMEQLRLSKRDLNRNELETLFFALFHDFDEEIQENFLPDEPTKDGEGTSVPNKTRVCTVS
ncbi:hypothetical protein GUITHDRAFT_112208 [Guillardia theta CCMP2712]|uniref:EF-hand domain-containing protein n=2 Tax=Guillardia theta TaxID=55529 RepID=L1J102_GUITC|nr:hypothetical protein GUITHDRAFT_112208 [Guillardia theta CCMP2712]EKX41789.1 hypothetical protein GUITHDRAFT_112208 [Guillardia theta CCMP2712]|mmetsp:Transcript_42428/g.133649  ORF Transcript_42428/g.133649 Transcript_42428/m.133649 type:complete len:213 (+) Transcript_42428:250-888(+)|eukprot:XP_005828769.1 hypothetical protein GUITHDRAFT_112208 [Guillardia theta CCMP2712]